MIGMKIDWLTLSRIDWAGLENEPVEDAGRAREWAAVALDEIGLETPVLKNIVPNRFYRYGFVDEISGAKCHIPVDVGAQGVLITFSGSVLDDPGAGAVILSAALDHGWKCTRVDVALDLLDEGYTAQDFYDAWLQQTPMPKRSYGFQKSASGSTFWVGSRQSERYTRIYDKGIKEGVGHVWTRIETEYKGRMAAVIATLVQKGASEAMPDLRYTLGFAPLSFQQALDRYTAVSAKRIASGSRRVRSPRERWFQEQVFNAFRNWAQEDYAASEAWVQALISLLDMM